MDCTIPTNPATPQAAPLAEAQVQLYHSKTAPTAAATLPLAAVLQDIQEGRWRLQVDACRGIYMHGTTAAYHAAKGKLPAVTFGGVFQPSRGNKNLRTHSGAVLADIDHHADPQTLKAQLTQDPHVAFAFLSPSGYGLKVGVRVAPVPDAVAYRHAWQVLAAHYERLTRVPWDPASGAVSGLCYVSCDPALHWEPHAAPFPVPPMPSQAAEPRAPATLPDRPHGQPASTATQRYAQHALRTAVRWILGSQLGTKHHTRLRAARLVGGHIATGALDYEVAWEALHKAIVATTTNLPNAERTLRDGLAYGLEKPIASPQVSQVEAEIASVHDDGRLEPALLAKAEAARQEQRDQSLPHRFPRLARMPSGLVPLASHLRRL